GWRSFAPRPAASGAIVAPSVAEELFDATFRAGPPRALRNWFCHGERRRVAVSTGKLRDGFGRSIFPSFQTSEGDQNAFGDGLFGRGDEPLVEPDGVSARDLIETAGDFGGSETAAQHL